jgi:hypothetical protein
MTILEVAVAYLGLHLLVYLLWLRRKPLFTREIVIVLYHFGSLGMIVVGLAIALVLSEADRSLAVVVAVVSLQGLYSVSFLEVWSLAEGGYSLSIMRSVDRARALGRPLGLADLHLLGEGKRSTRTRHLASLGLVRDRDGKLELSASGRLVATALFVITRVANLREVG